MKLYTSVLILLLLIVLIPDVFFYLKLRNHKTKPFYIILHLLFPIFFGGFFLYIKFGLENLHNFRVVWWIMWLYFIFLLIYIPKLLHIISYFLNYLFKKKINRDIPLLNPLRILISSFVVLLMCVSAFYTPRNFEVTHAEVVSDLVPAAFDGFKIVQISDVHLGSWNRDYERLNRIIELINQQHADIIVFTGDMVNNFATETVGWDIYFLQLQAKYAKFAVIGNHDYGDYTHWKSVDDRKENSRKINFAIEKFGFNLLLNEHAFLHKDSDSIMIAGVENWGKSEAFRYSDLTKALSGSTKSQPVILLTHDPNHWDAEVVGNENIFLTLSGHTHAAQAGIKIMGKLFSPAAFVFKHWSGLYKTGTQYLYVNRGVGYIGLPMMLGVRPEITVITLKKSSK